MRRLGVAMPSGAAFGIALRGPWKLGAWFGQCDERVTIARPTDPGLQPEDERSALVQRLDQYRAIAGIGLVDLPWRQASAPLLPATNMTIAGIVKHLAWAEDRWFRGGRSDWRCPPYGIDRALALV